jgi:hypothetical protein
MSNYKRPLPRSSIDRSISSRFTDVRLQIVIAKLGGVGAWLGGKQGAENGDLNRFLKHFPDRYQPKLENIL